MFVYALSTICCWTICCSMTQPTRLKTKDSTWWDQVSGEDTLSVHAREGALVEPTAVGHAIATCTADKAEYIEDHASDLRAADSQ